MQATGSSRKYIPTHTGVISVPGQGQESVFIGEYQMNIHVNSMGKGSACCGDMSASGPGEIPNRLSKFKAGSLFVKALSLSTTLLPWSTGGYEDHDLTAGGVCMAVRVKDGNVLTGHSVFTTGVRVLSFAAYARKTAM
jgi:hypothetical protein